VKEDVDHFEISDGQLLDITTDNALSNCSITWVLQSILQISGIEGSASKNHIPCMAQVIQLCLGTFVSNLGVKGHTKAWEAHEYDKQFVEKKSAPTINIQKLQMISNTQIHKVSTMNAGLAIIIEKETTI
jgi:hypothetical protein